MTRCAALELAKHGIRVNGIYPGAIDTPMIQLNPAGFNDAIVATMPLARMGTPDEIADAVTFLTSAEAAYITGAELPVDGGGAIRSEEHTSELQSLMRISYAVFCLKKKKKK